MSKSQACSHCENFSGYTGETFLVCAMYPAGPEHHPCPDFEQAGADFQLSSAALVDGNLVITQAQLSELDDLNIDINPHPSLTGRCPECGFDFNDCLRSPTYWDCDRCGWMDDSTE